MTQKLRRPARKELPPSEHWRKHLAFTYTAIAFLAMTSALVFVLCFVREAQLKSVEKDYAARIGQAWERLDATTQRIDEYAQTLAGAKWVQKLSAMREKGTINARVDAIERNEVVKALSGNMRLIHADLLGVYFMESDLVASSYYFHDANDFFGGRISFSCPDKTEWVQLKDGPRFSEPGKLRLFISQRDAVGYSTAIPIYTSGTQTVRLIAYFNIQTLKSLLQIDQTGGCVLRLVTQSGATLYADPSAPIPGEGRWAWAEGSKYLRVQGENAQTGWRAVCAIPLANIRQALYFKYLSIFVIYLAALVVIGVVCIRLAGMKIRPYEKLNALLREPPHEGSNSKSAREYMVKVQEAVRGMANDFNRQRGLLKVYGEQLKEYSLKLLLSDPDFHTDTGLKTMGIEELPRPLIRCAVVCAPDHPGAEPEALFEECCAQCDIQACAFRLDGRLVFVLNYDDEEAFARLLQALEKRLPPLSEGRVLAGFGPATQKDGLRDSYRKALLTLGERKNACVSVYTRDGETRAFHALDKIEDMIACCLRDLNRDMAQEIIRTAFQNHNGVSAMTPREARDAASMIFVFTVKLLREASGESEIVMESPPPIAQSDSTQEIVEKARGYLLRAIDALEDTPDRKNELAARIVRYLHDHIGDTTLTLSSVADSFHISSAHLNRMLRAHYQTSFLTYLCKIRMDQAMRLLSTTDGEIKRIALLCGYDSDATFRRIFKSVKGVTPSQYRATAQMRKSVQSPQTR